MSRTEKPTCKDCKHWKPEQAELDYSTLTGFCTCYKLRFTTNNDESCMLLDRQNRTEKHMGVSRFENQNNQIPFGTPERSRYLLVTDDKFGCIHHQKR